MYPHIFEIRIDNESKKYYAGQSVEGRVVIAVQKEKAVKGVDIRIVGKGNVYWDTGIKHNNIFNESEIYLNKTFNLLSPEEGRQTTLQPGTYEYFFSIPLPVAIPSSLESQHCFIRYYLEAVIHRQWKDEQTVQILFYVTSITDLNLSPHAAVPASFQKEKNVGFSICQTGPINLNFMIGKTGFVPGEYLQFGVEIRNTSGTRVNRVQIALKRMISCHARGETKPTHEKIFQLNGPSAETAGYLLWQSNFEIPNLTPSKLIGCEIISLQYYVEIKLGLDKWADVKFNMPIIIGSIAFRRDEKLELQASPVKIIKTVGFSTITSPILGEEFKYKESWGQDDKTGSAAITPVYNGLVGDIPVLPPLDLALFQKKPERHPHFRSYEDCDCEFLYPFRITSPLPQEYNQPPRPHSNPGNFWERSGNWGNENE